MFDGYRDLLSRPGARSFTFAGFVSRLIIPMFNISLILMIQIQYDSYAIAGQVAAIGVFVWAAQTVPTARLVDRFGQRAAMWPLVALHVAGTVIAVATSMLRGPVPFLWVAVVFASLSGPVGSLTRARWSHILTTEQEIHSAFSLEGALDEVLFVGGPLVATVLTTSVHPAAGILTASAALVVGMGILLPQTASEPPARRGTGGGGLGLRVPRPVIAVTLVSTAMGLIFGAFDISVVAFADSLGLKPWAGAVLGVVAFGSFLGSLAYGARRWRWPMWARIVVASGIVAVGFSVVSLQSGLVALAIVGFFAGSAIAPLFATSDAITQRSVRRDQLTEGLAWSRIGIGVGVGIGAWLGGGLIESEGARAGLHFSGGAAILVAFTALATIPWLRAVGRRRVREADVLVDPSPVPPNI